MSNAFFIGIVFTLALFWVFLKEEKSGKEKAEKLRSLSDEEQIRLMVSRDGPKSFDEHLLDGVNSESFRTYLSLFIVLSCLGGLVEIIDAYKLRLSVLELLTGAVVLGYKWFALILSGYCVCMILAALFSSGREREEKKKDVMYGARAISIMTMVCFVCYLFSPSWIPNTQIKDQWLLHLFFLLFGLIIWFFTAYLLARKDAK